jgi:ribonucleotide monophosphatase NagD (HAD superfamily)
VETTVGKPSLYMTDTALEQLGVPATRAAMVGDRLETDVAMGLNAGLISILTLSGVSSRKDLEDSPVRPDYVIESLAELPDLDEQLAK